MVPRFCLEVGCGVRFTRRNVLHRQEPQLIFPDPAVPQYPWPLAKKNPGPGASFPPSQETQWSKVHLWSLMAPSPFFSRSTSTTVRFLQASAASARQVDKSHSERTSPHPMIQNDPRSLHHLPSGNLTVCYWKSPFRSWIFPWKMGGSCQFVM